MSTSRSHNEFEDFYGHTVVQINPQNGEVEHTYKFGDFIGKGGFAQVYICDCIDENKRYAMKIIRKASLVKSKVREKLFQEIEIHKSLDHCYIVKFYRHFEDNNYHYILLELCSNKSLAQLLKTRKRLTEPEVQYFALQLISALEYLHSHYIIHRDIKLANLLLDSNLNIKLADFGLAAKLTDKEDRKMSMCGTPNYIAPEILASREHRSYSYEVDIWSFGVVIYTLLIGRPPFETSDIKSTYQKIKEVDYQFPDVDILIGDNARHFIRALLHEDPSHRLTLAEMKEHPFFTASPVPPPKVLPLSILSQPLYLPAPTPTLPTPVIMKKKSFTSFQERESHDHLRATTVGSTVQHHPNIHEFDSNNMNVHVHHHRSDRPDTVSNNAIIHHTDSNNKLSASNGSIRDRSKYQKMILHNLLSHPLYQAIYESLRDIMANPSLASYPSSPTNIPWITEVFDYTSMFGIGYLYEDYSVGVFFNDLTTIFYNHHTKVFTYREPVSCASYIINSVLPTPVTGTLDNYPQFLYKKAPLLKYFRQCLTEQRAKHDKSGTPKVMFKPLVNDPPFVIAWHVTEYAHIFIFNEGTIQMNFFGGTAVSFNIQKNVVVYFDKNRTYNTFSLEDALSGSKPDLIRRLLYIRNVLENMISQE